MNHSQIETEQGRIDLIESRKPSNTNVYEDILNPLAGAGMDLLSLLHTMTLTPEQEVIVKRMKSNMTLAMEANRKLGVITRSMADLMETIYPNRHWDMYKAYNMAIDESREQ